MIGIPNLHEALLDLLHELQDTEIRIIIGGGYGIFLKTERVRRSDARTLLREWPQPRSTNDLDLFLRPELLTDSEKLKPLVKAIHRLGYRVVSGAEKYQFFKPGPDDAPASSVKIDILTGPKSRFVGTGVKADSRRIRPNPSVGIHAHPLDAALTLDVGLTMEPLTGALSSGEDWHGEIYLPHSYTFSLMKIFAFRDRFNDADKEFGRYHALDLYSILATMTEDEWQSAREMSAQYGAHAIVREAGQLVSEYFSEIERPGMIRLRESPYFRPELQLDQFMSALAELFPENDSG